MVRISLNLEEGHSGLHVVIKKDEELVNKQTNHQENRAYHRTQNVCKVCCVKSSRSNVDNPPGENRKDFKGYTRDFEFNWVSFKPSNLKYLNKML